MKSETGGKQEFNKIGINKENEEAEMENGANGKNGNHKNNGFQNGKNKISSTEKTKETENENEKEKTVLFSEIFKSGPAIRGRNPHVQHTPTPYGHIEKEKGAERGPLSPYLNSPWSAESAESLEVKNKSNSCFFGYAHGI